MNSLKTIIYSCIKMLCWTILPIAIPIGSEADDIFITLNDIDFAEPKVIPGLSCRHCLIDSFNVAICQCSSGLHVTNLNSSEIIHHTLKDEHSYVIYKIEDTFYLYSHVDMSMYIMPEEHRYKMTKRGYKLCNLNYDEDERVAHIINGLDNKQLIIVSTFNYSVTCNYSGYRESIKLFSQGKAVTLAVVNEDLDIIYWIEYDSNEYYLYQNTTKMFQIDEPYCMVSWEDNLYICTLNSLLEITEPEMNASTVPKKHNIQTKTIACHLDCCIYGSQAKTYRICPFVETTEAYFTTAITTVPTTKATIMPIPLTETIEEMVWFRNTSSTDHTAGILFLFCMYALFVWFYKCSVR